MKILPLKQTEEPCPYIDGRSARMEHYLIPAVDEEELDVLLAAGYRHFGTYFFRPACSGCGRCLPIRVSVSGYRRSRSAVRCLHRIDSMRVFIRRPEPSEEAFRLYRRHLMRFGDGGTDNFRAFRRSFYHSFSFSRELAIYDRERLVCCALFDLTGTSLSAIYCFYDDRYARESLGSAAVFRELAEAEGLGLRWVYLGYWIPENRHMTYKSRFRPNQLLVDEGAWSDYILADGRAAFDHAKAAFLPHTDIRIG